MGMPITVEILDARATEADIERVFAYFRSIDETFSTYKAESEISKINRGELAEEEYSDAVKTILALSEQTRQETQGYFDIERDGLIDPSGIVKGWAIFQAAQMLKEAGFVNFYIDAGGDIQVAGTTMLAGQVAGYLSGPPDMVRANERMLKDMQVDSKQMKKDFFPGLV